MKCSAFLVLTAALILSACAQPRNGVNGDAGAPGAVGPQGPGGTDATPVTVVNLCPGAPAYPAVFIETALCVGNKLYGVYSANGGFLTYLPPGAYTSNAIGSACNFTVGANCTIVH